MNESTLAEYTDAVITASERDAETKPRYGVYVRRTDAGPSDWKRIHYAPRTASAAERRADEMNRRAAARGWPYEYVVCQETPDAIVYHDDAVSAA